jgi:hypothetical protein
MGTNRTRTTRSRKTSTPLDKTIKDFLFFGLDYEPPKGSPGDDLRISRFFGYSEIKAVWLEHRAVLMAEWKRTRRRGLPWAAKFDEEVK